MNVLIDERQKKQATTEEALDAERSRATDLARQADGLKDLIAKLESGLDAATRTAHADARSIEEDATRPDLSALKDPGRLAPAIAFAAARGRLRLPVNGVKIREFGGSDGSGGTQKGQSIATHADAQITSPCDGWVVYAGPFRSYGQLLILNAGGGYHVLLAGMERISVDLETGVQYLAGEPVAVMGSGAAGYRNGGDKVQTTCYSTWSSAKTAAPTDPSPWWAGNKRRRKGSRMMRKTSLIFLGRDRRCRAHHCWRRAASHGIRPDRAQRPPPPDAYRQLQSCSATCSSGCAAPILRRETLDDSKLVESAINGMLKPGSIRIPSYMDRKSFRDMQVQTRGEFGGLRHRGDDAMEDGLVKVVAPDRRNAGGQGRHVMANDIITKLDDVQVQGLTLNQAVEKMRGPVNTKIKLTIMRKGADKPIDADHRA